MTEPRNSLAVRTDAPLLATCRSLLGRVADTAAWWQQQAVGALVLATLLLILLNVVTRAFNVALFWVDELAIYTAVWAFMLGAAASVRGRQATAITLAHDASPAWFRPWLTLLRDTVVVAFGASLVVFSWLWFDPRLLVAADFDVGAFIQASFNFVYREQTSTLGVAKWWVWLIMPVMAVLTCLHASANWLDSLEALLVRGGAERP